MKTELSFLQGKKELPSSGDIEYKDEVKPNGTNKSWVVEEAEYCSRKDIRVKDTHNAGLVDTSETLEPEIGSVKVSKDDDGSVRLNTGREPSVSSNCPKMLACSSCAMTFKSRNDLYLHLQNEHKHRLFPCPWCGKLFNRSSSLKTHLRVHTGERPYRCVDCGKSFTQLSNVLQHTRDVHLKDKRFVCEVCKKGFTRLETLQSHRRVHTGEKAYSCEVCLKAFSQRANLKVHDRTHRVNQPDRKDGEVILQDHMIYLISTNRLTP